jgi:hypothetical protein
MILTPRSLAFLILSTIISMSDGQGQTSGFRSRLGNYNCGGTLGLGAYQTYGSMYLDLRRSARMETLTLQEESRLYNDMLYRLIRPRYLLMQLSVYPLAALSSYLETDHPSLYNRCYLTDTFNLLRAVGLGPEEPYALSLFWGNIAIFTRLEPDTVLTKGKKKQTGSAVVGFQVSAGHWHLQDNIRVDDWWIEPELRLKGALNEPGIRRLSWNFHAGLKLHQNPVTADVVVLAFQRDRSDWTYRGWSLAKNSFFEYSVYLAIDRASKRSFPWTRHLALLGKKYPFYVGKKPILLRLGVGLLWEWTRRYDHNARQFEQKESARLEWLIQPNLEF